MLTAAPARYPRTGWHTATVLTVCFGGLAVVLSAISLVGIWFAIWAFVSTCLVAIAAFVDNRTWRAVCSGVGLLGFLWFVVFSALWGVLTSWLGWGLILICGSLAGLGALVSCIVEFIRTINGQDMSVHARQGYLPAAPVLPQIIISNNNNAQVGNNDQRWGIPSPAGAGSSARMGIIDSTRPGREISVSVGQRLIVGRDATADIRLADPKVSRRHLEVEFDGASWIIRDLGGTNPAGLLASGRMNPLGRNAQLQHGQISLGDSVITLYPANLNP